MTELVPCRECRRHVRVGSPCPFCGADSQIRERESIPSPSGAVRARGTPGTGSADRTGGPRSSARARECARQQTRAPGRFALLFAGAIGLSACGEQASPDLEPPPEAPPPVEAEPVELEARPVEPEPVEPVPPVEVAPAPVVDEPEPRVIARPRPPEPVPVPAYGGPALRRPTPDPGGAVAAYGGPSTMGPDSL